MKQLKKLQISESPVTKIEGLEDLDSLESLDLTSLKINKMENIDHLKNLEKIFVPRYKKTEENINYLKQLQSQNIRLIR